MVKGIILNRKYKSSEEQFALKFIFYRCFYLKINLRLKKGLSFSSRPQERQPTAILSIDYRSLGYTFDRELKIVLLLACALVRLKPNEEDSFERRALDATINRPAGERLSGISQSHLERRTAVLQFAKNNFRSFETERRSAMRASPIDLRIAHDTVSFPILLS